MDVVRSLMEKATSLGKLEEMCNLQDAAGKTPFDMAAAGQHKVRAYRRASERYPLVSVYRASLLGAGQRAGQG